MDTGSHNNSNSCRKTVAKDTKQSKSIRACTTLDAAIDHVRSVGKSASIYRTCYGFRTVPRIEKSSGISKQSVDIDVGDGDKNIDAIKKESGAAAVVTVAAVDVEGEVIVGADVGAHDDENTNADVAATAVVVADANGDGQKNVVPLARPRTPRHQAKRIKFYRHGDRYHAGVIIPVSFDRYRTFDSLCEDITRIFARNLKMSGAVRTIYTAQGIKIKNIEEFEIGQNYFCCCNNETFKKVKAKNSSKPVRNEKNICMWRLRRPPNMAAFIAKHSDKPKESKLLKRNSGVFARIVILIRHGTRPRRIVQLLLNKRNSPSFEHVIQAITKAVNLNTGYVRKVYTLWGSPVHHLADFFSLEDIFIAFGKERIEYPDDFELDLYEHALIEAMCKKLRNVGRAYMGPKPIMPSSSICNTDEKANSDAAEPNESVPDSDPAPESEQDCDTEKLIAEMPSDVLHRYETQKMVGSGHFAIVLKVTDRITSSQYAIKIIDKVKAKDDFIDAEVRIMRRLKHPHIMPLVNVINKPEKMFLIMQYMKDGDLYNYYASNCVSEDEARLIIQQLSSALVYLHRLNIVHRDIKPENILVELNDEETIRSIRLVDFGLACCTTKKLFFMCGTPAYVAPEILSGNGYSHKVDVWSTGVTLFVLLCRAFPFQNQGEDELFETIIIGNYEYPDDCSDDITAECKNLIAKMLEIDPEKRCTSKEIMYHSWTNANRKNFIWI